MEPVKLSNPTVSISKYIAKGFLFPIRMGLFARSLDILRTEGLISFFDSAHQYLVERLLSENHSWRYFTEIRYVMQRMRYNNPANPYKLIWVDPSNINFYNRNYIWDKPGIGKIIGGKWDLHHNRTELSEHYIYSGLEQRFADSYSWEETDYYENAESAYQSGQKKWGYETLEDFREQRCNYVDSLYEDIKKNGYRPNSKSTHCVPENDQYRKKRTHIHELEPLVMIGRDGEFHLSEGFHRVAIADIQKIDHIPVNVLARHRKWQKRREYIDSTSSTCTHPDLKI